MNEVQANSVVEVIEGEFKGQIGFYYADDYSDDESFFGAVVYFGCPLDNDEDYHIIPFDHLRLSDARHLGYEKYHRRVDDWDKEATEDAMNTLYGIKI